MRRQITTKLIPLAELEQRDIGRWRELAAVALEPNPFFEPQYLLALARGLGELERVALAVVDDGESWLACMPVHRVERWHRIPVRATAMWRGHAIVAALVGTPLISRTRARDATLALVSGVVRQPRSLFAAFEWLVEGGPVFEAFRATLAEAGLRSMLFERYERAFLTRHADGGYLERAMSSKHRRNLRSQWQRMGEELGEELTAVERAGEQAAVEQLMELERRSYLAERGTVLAGDPGHARFFREMCAAFAGEGRLQLLALQAGDRTLAMKCNILAGAGVFYYKMAYDEDYARFSPGIQLEARMLELFEQRAESAWIDSCASPNNATMNKLLRERRSLVTLTVLDPSLRAIALAPVMRGARYMRNRALERSLGPSASAPAPPAA
ncbi:MAG TPA: GNAT family N-acetyltransferase [Solirubrobacteraceae bacterium]|nr:GNAT family N-acetyltransferase [Solirubrobacteraceae bacterium]